MRKVLPVTIIATVLLFFVSINVLVSQLYPSLMFKVLQFNDLAATKQFLAHIEGTPFYETQYAYLNKLFSNAFVADDIQAEFSLKSELDRLNNLLEKIKIILRFSLKSLYFILIKVTLHKLVNIISKRRLLILGSTSTS